MSDLFTDKPQLKVGLHSHLVDGLTGPCVACGAVQKWVVPVEPVGTLTVDKPAAGWSFATGDAVSGFTKLPPGKYLIVPKGADDE